MIGSGISFYHDFRVNQQKRLAFTQRDSRSSKIIGGITTTQYQQLAKHNYHAGRLPIIQVNHGKSTLNPKAWQKNRVIYQQLDNQGRTSTSNTAFLQQRNLAVTALRIQQAVQPTGWHANRNGNLIYNRGHLIAYSLTGGINQKTGHYQSGAVGDQDNVRNLFTETDFTNQELQTIYEAMVRRAIEHGKHVVYQATPIFRGNEQLARGINLQALSTDGTLNFNVYLFNVEPGIRLNYTDGTTTSDPQMQIPVPPTANNSIKDNETSDSNSSLKVIDHYVRPIAFQPRHYRRIN